MFSKRTLFKFLAIVLILALAIGGWLLVRIQEGSQLIKTERELLDRGKRLSLDDNFGETINIYVSWTGDIVLETSMYINLSDLTHEQISKINSAIRDPFATQNSIDGFQEICSLPLVERVINSGRNFFNKVFDLTGEYIGSVQFNKYRCDRAH